MGAWGVSILESDSGLDWMSELSLWLQDDFESGITLFRMQRCYNGLKASLRRSIEEDNKRVPAGERQYYIDAQYNSRVDDITLLIAHCLALCAEDEGFTYKICKLKRVGAKGKRVSLERAESSSLGNRRVSEAYCSREEMAKLLEEVKIIADPKSERSMSWIPKFRSRWLAYINKIVSVLEREIANADTTA